MARDPLEIIEALESRGRNVPNYKYGPGFSASGHYQIINETWRRWAQGAGIDIRQYPRAIDAPKEVQRKVAAYGYSKEGFRPWEAVKHLRGQEGTFGAPGSGVLSASGTAPPPAAPTRMGNLTDTTPATQQAAAVQQAYDLNRYLANKGVNTSGFGGALNQGLGRAFADMPPELKASIYSGYRDRAHQQRLWDASDKSGHMVARPGHSQHGFGNAADLRYASPAAREWMHANAAKYGLAFPLAHEPWHVEAAGARPGGKPVNYALGNAPAYTDGGGAAPGGVIAAADGTTAPAPTVEASTEGGVQAFNDALAGVQQQDAAKAQQAQAADQAQEQQAQASQAAAAQQQTAAVNPEGTAAGLMTSLLERKRVARAAPVPGVLSAWST